ncbi:MAG: hypothetical protein Q8P79_01940 [Nanoarchaeota archaeon]|nr:hypothetical protein [Nanoarchaeota archaeon]
MSGPGIEMHSDYWVFPRENYQRLEKELSSSALKYDIDDENDGLVYLEIRESSVLPRSLQEFFVGLHGERLNSKKDLEQRMHDGQNVGSAFLEDLPDELRINGQ